MTHRHLPVLSDDDCWCLFQQHAKGVSGLFEKRVIIEKCKGLPLVAKALGGLLKSEGHESKCQMILNSNTWSEKSSVLPVLRLSYDHLPSNLKRVFAYCSVYPKDYEFKEMELVLSWMAQGFLPGNQSERMEDVGHTYFFDLVSRSLFEQSPSGEDRFIMHDLIHDLAQWAAGGICWVPEDKQRDRARTRHLFLSKHCIDETLGNRFLAPPQLRTQLRTFIGPRDCYNDGLDAKLLDYIQKLKYVRTLELALEETEELPDLFGGLIHLRCLTLSITKIKVLPKSLSKLCNLQTLDLYGCRCLEEIPDMSFLVKLRCLKIGRTCLKEMPVGIGKLTNLQTLDRFSLGARGGSRVRELKNLNHLHGSLKIYGLGNVIKVEDAQEAQLQKKMNLEELYLYWQDLDNTARDVADDTTARDVVEQLKPPSSIKNCHLSGYKGLALPCWLGYPSFKNMVRIRLSKCMRCEHLPPLGQLPKLKILCIEDMGGIKQVGPGFYGSYSTPFPSLTSLKLAGMDSWEKWEHPAVDNSRAFTCLEELTVYNCKSLEYFPPLGQLPKLEFLFIGGMRGIKQVDLEFYGSCPTPFPALKRLEFRNMDSWETWVHSPGDNNRAFTRLEELTIYNCKSLQGSIPPHLPSLKELRIKTCKKMSVSLPSLLSPEKLIIEISGLHGGGGFRYLGKKLVIENCQSLITCELVNELNCLSSLKLLGCKNMESLPSQLHNFSSLKELFIHECPEIQCFPEGGLPKNLTRLSIYKMKKLLNLGSSHSTLPNLTELKLINCPNLESLFVDHVVLASLTELILTNCPNFRFFPKGCLFKNLMGLKINATRIETPIKEWGLHLLTSLDTLILNDVGSSSYTIECTSDLHLPSSLESVFLKGFKNLKTINCSNLPKLTDVRIGFCPNFESFGDNGLPSQLKRVDIERCDILQQKLRSDPQGRIWIGGEKRYSVRLDLSAKQCQELKTEEDILFEGESS